MTQNKKLGNLFQISTSLPFFSAALECIDTENFADTLVRRQLIDAKSTCFYIPYIATCQALVNHFYILLHNPAVFNISPEWSIFSEVAFGLATVGGAA